MHVVNWRNVYVGPGILTQRRLSKARSWGWGRGAASLELGWKACSHVCLFHLGPLSTNLLSFLYTCSGLPWWLCFKLSEIGYRFKGLVWNRVGKYFIFLVWHRPQGFEKRATHTHPNSLGVPNPGDRLWLRGNFYKPVASAAPCCQEGCYIQTNALPS